MARITFLEITSSIEFNALLMVASVKTGICGHSLSQFFYKQG